MLVDANMYPNTTYDDYEPCKSSTSTIPLSEPLRAIGDVKDEITYQDGKWGVLRRIGKYVIDGTENLILPSTNISDYGISLRMGDYTNILKGISTVSENTADMVTNYLRCRELDHIIYYHSGTIVDYGSGIYRTSGNIWLSFGASDIEKMGITKDVDSVKTWLSSHNITVHYPLGTPVFEPFADQTLPYLSTYDGVTNISNGDALSAEMTVKYPTTDASGVGSRNESRIAELAKDTDDKFDDVNESLGAYDINENATGSYSKSKGFAIEWIKMCKATKGTYKLSYTINGSTGGSSEIALGKSINDKTLYRNIGLISDGIYEQIIDITSDTDIYIMVYTNGSITISNIKFTLQNIANEVGNLRNDLAPKKIELQNVDERVTIQDNGSFIINGFAFVNLLVTFNETIPQWSNFVRLPRPKDGNIPVHCENSVRFTIYSQDNLPGDCGTYETVASGTEIRLLVNYEVA